MAKTGLQVIEGVASGITPFVESSKHNIGLLMERERGVPNKVERIDSLQQDRKIFGGIDATKYGAFITRHIFNNAGNFGATVYGARIVGSGSNPAVGTLTDGAPSSETLVATEIQPAVAQEVEVTLTGTSGTANVTINGVNSYVATFNTTLTQTALDFVATHAATILSVEDIIVTANAGVLTLVSNTPGTGISAVCSNLTGDLSGTDGTTVSNQVQITWITPGGVGVGDTFELTIGTSTVTFVATSPTVAHVTAGLLTAINNEIGANPGGDWDNALVGGATDASTHVVLTGGYFTVTPSTTNGAANSIITIRAGQRGQQDPGTWGNNLVVRFYPIGHPNGLAQEYLMEVFLSGVLVEQLSAPTWAELITLVTDRSYYVVLYSINLTFDIYDIQNVTLASGTYTAPVEADFYPVYSTTAPEGLALFDGYDVQLIANSEHHTDTMALQGRDYCALRQNRMYVANLPYLADDSAVENFADTLQEDGPSFIAGYNVWVRTNDESGSFAWVPGIGCVLGAGFVRTPNLQRDQIWIPPAGLDSVFRDVIDISPNPLSQETIDLYVKRYTTNVVVFRKGKGFFLMSSRTYATNGLYHSVHIRRMTSFLVETLKNNLQFVIQKPNTVGLRREIIVAVTSYFRGIYNDGGLETTVPFEEAFEVVADTSNNPASQDRKELNVDVNWIPVEASESISIRLNRNDGVLIAKALQQ